MNCEFKHFSAVFACLTAVCFGKPPASDASQESPRITQGSERQYAESIIRALFADPATSPANDEELQRFRAIVLADFSVFDEDTLSFVFLHTVVGIVLQRQGDQNLDSVLQLAADIACSGYARAYEAWAGIEVPDGPTNRQHLVVEGLSKRYPGSNGVLHIEGNEADQRLYEQAVRDLESRRQIELKKSGLEQKLRTIEFRYRKAFKALMERLPQDNAERLREQVALHSDDRIDFLQAFEINIEPAEEAE